MAELSEQFIDRIYEASFAPEKWSLLLEDLAKAIDGMGGCLFTVVRGASAYVASQSMAPHLDAFMRDGWTELNTRSARAIALDRPGFVTDPDIYSAAELETEPIYRDFLRPRGMGWGAGLYIPLPTGDMLAFGLERSSDKGPLESRYVEALDRLRPHIVRAAAISARIGLDKARAGADMLETLGLPAAVLGAQGQLLACNRPMEGLIPEVIRDGSTRLQIADKKADALLEAALAASSRSNGRTIAQSFPITDKERRTSGVVHLLPARGAALDLFSRIHSVLVVMPLSVPNAPQAKMLQVMFDFTPSEARIAAALAEGRSIDAIGEDFSIARETVRSHLRSIFAKSGVSKQSALVRLLLSITLPGASS